MVWRFTDAPEAWRKLAEPDIVGRETWLAFIPLMYVGFIEGWLESGSAFGTDCVRIHWLSNGSQIRIGARAAA